MPASEFRLLRGLRTALVGVGLLVAPMHGALAAGQVSVPTAEAAPAEPAPSGWRYEPGRGWRHAASGLTVGGYGEAVYADPAGDDWEAGVNALSSMIWWQGRGRLSFASELELERPVFAGPGRRYDDEVEPVLERLHLDYVRGDALKLRAGKFLTPVGRWNQIHAAPLTWTTSRPLITEETFPTNATGLMIHGVLPWTDQGLEYAVYAAPGEEILAESDLDTFREAIGGRLATGLLPHTQFGLSYANFELESDAPVHRYLLGADFLWSWRRFELSGEFALRTIDRSERNRDERGYYVQAVLPLADRLYAVLRHERLDSEDEPGDLRLYVAGINLRVRSGIVLKAEYAHANGDDDPDRRSGLLASFAFLF